MLGSTYATNPSCPIPLFLLHQSMRSDVALHHIIPLDLRIDGVAPFNHTTAVMIHTRVCPLQGHWQYTDDLIEWKAQPMAIKALEWDLSHAKTLQARR